MVARIFPTALLLAAVAAGSAQAQSNRVPAEIPPQDYTDSQYVDSNGCVFVRAGFNGGISWVPRFDDNRQPMCGFAPSLGGSVASEVAAGTDTTEPAPSAPAPVTIAATEGGESRLRLRTPELAVAPQPIARAPRPARVAAPRTPRVTHPDVPQVFPSPTAQTSARHRRTDWSAWDGLNPRVPSPYAYAVPQTRSARWQDGYLSGERATSPVGDAPQRSVTTYGAAAQPAQGGGIGRATAGQYVQIGTFGVGSHAQAAIGYLRANGLPVALGRATSMGSEFQIVLAGPFAPEQLATALAHARALGYRDAFVR